jgi:hypothetical protein
VNDAERARRMKAEKWPTTMFAANRAIATAYAKYLPLVEHLHTLELCALMDAARDEAKARRPFIDTRPVGIGNRL